MSQSGVAVLPDWVGMMGLAASAGREAAPRAPRLAMLRAFSLAGSDVITAARSRRLWPDHRREAAAYWVFAGYAVAVVLLARGQDAVWAAWALPAYGVAAVMLPRTRPVGVALLTAAFAAAAPLLLLRAQGGELAAGMAVIERSAALLIRDGTPVPSAGAVVVLAGVRPLSAGHGAVRTAERGGTAGAPRGTRGSGWSWSPWRPSAPRCAPWLRTPCCAARTAATTCCAPPRSPSHARYWLSTWR